MEGFLNDHGQDDHLPETEEEALAYLPSGNEGVKRSCLGLFRSYRGMGYSIVEALVKVNLAYIDIVEKRIAEEKREERT